MPKHIDTSSWKDTGTDIAYKDPFSPTTTNIRKKLIIFSSISILNYYFPIDISKSHLLGLHFSTDASPTLSGLLGCIVLYFVISLTIYTFQEIKAWLAQAHEMEYVKYKTELQKIVSYNQATNNALVGANEQLQLHHEKIATDEYKQSDEKERLHVHLLSFINFVNDLSESNDKHINAINETEALLNQSYKNFKSAMYTQAIKIGILEILLPFLLASFSIYFSFNGIANIINVIF